MNSYSHIRGMFAITKASLIAIFRSPSAVVFGFAFPFIFILVFGFIGDNGGRRTYKIALDQNIDTSNVLYTALQNSGSLSIIRYQNEKLLLDDLNKGRIAGIINIQKNSEGGSPYMISLKSTSSSNDQWPQVKAVIESAVNGVSDAYYSGRPKYATFNFNYKKDIAEIREYKTIDFILPGQLGFSLLASGVFGVAFMFFNLRNTLVLKRFFATPISRTYIILGEMFSRVIFQMLTAVVIILAGYYFFGFTLIHGFKTFLEMLVLSFTGLIVFMGFGFIVSGLAKNDSTIPPFANLITLPQFLIGGTFFSVDVFPKWLQPISKAMPLTHLNTALRAVAFEGQNLWDVKMEIGILLLWGVAIYTVAIKVFKWE
ncbi:MAG: ABC transporter permease [Ginsengibacter sp.]